MNEIESDYTIQDASMFFFRSKFFSAQLYFSVDLWFANATIICYRPNIISCKLLFSVVLILCHLCQVWSHIFCSSSRLPNHSSLLILPEPEQIKTVRNEIALCTYGRHF